MNQIGRTNCKTIWESCRMEPHTEKSDTCSVGDAELNWDLWPMLDGSIFNRLVR